MGSMKIFDNQISSRDSLRNCIEFAYTDLDICRDINKKKLIKKFHVGKSSSNSRDVVYNCMLDGCRKWTQEKSEEFLYVVFGWEKGTVEAEDIFELFIRYVNEYFIGMPVLMSVHEDETGVYVHLLVRKMVDGEVMKDYLKMVTLPEYFYRYAMKDKNVSSEINEYFDLIHYMIY